MEDGFPLLGIIIFALVAGFLAFRLYSVLGRRTGTEQRRDPFVAARDKVVVLPPRGAAVEMPREPASAPTGSVATQIAGVKAADPGFDETAFLRGGRGAFEIIVNAFAKGDTAALRPLLSDEVYASFAEAIRARQTARETLATNLVSIKAVEIAEAAVEGDSVLVTVRFVSEQINVTGGPDGATVDGDPERVVEKTDLWTFARRPRARDPNWTLVATHSA